MSIYSPLRSCRLILWRALGISAVVAVGIGLHLLGMPSPAQADADGNESDRRVWTGKGWNVHWSSDLTSPACFAVRVFSFGSYARTDIIWSLTNTHDGRWFVLVKSDDGASMVGKPTAISVDGQVIHHAIPESGEHGGVVLLGELTGEAAEAMARGRILRIHPSSGFSRAAKSSFSLRGSRDALQATMACVVGLKAVVDCGNTDGARRKTATCTKAR